MSKASLRQKDGWDVARARARAPYGTVAKMKEIAFSWQHCLSLESSTCHRPCEWSVRASMTSRAREYLRATGASKFYFLCWFLFERNALGPPRARK